MAFLLVIHAVAATPAAAQEADRPEAACESAEERAFDFWLGDWRVADASGRTLGHNRIRRVADGCALLEEWRGAGGGTGVSLNTSGGDGGWRQFWVGGAGLRLELRGGLEGDAMVMRGRRSTSRGELLDRVTWRPLGDGRVEQLWEQSRDEGASWTVIFRGLYEPAGAAAVERRSGE